MTTVDASEVAALTCNECAKPVDMVFHGSCKNCLIDSYDLVDDPDDDGEYEDCGLMPNGQCTRAGSEECDWECGRLH